MLYQEERARRTKGCRQERGIIHRVGVCVRFRYLLSTVLYRKVARRPVSNHPKATRDYRTVLCTWLSQTDKIRYCTVLCSIRHDSLIYSICSGLLRTVCCNYS